MRGNLKSQRKTKASKKEKALKRKTVEKQTDYCCTIFVDEAPLL
jgi:hypothetical protein